MLTMRASLGSKYYHVSNVKYNFYFPWENNYLPNWSTAVLCIL